MIFATASLTFFCSHAVITNSYLFVIQIDFERGNVIQND